MSINQFYLCETSLLNLRKHQMSDICSVRIGVLYLISEISQWNTYNYNTKMKQIKGLSGDPIRIQGSDKQDHDGPDRT